MHRLFVAIRPPGPVRDLLIDLMEGVSGARWQSDDQLHLTLRFIGEVDRHGANDIAAALGGIHAPAFDLAISGLGTFVHRGRPDTLWAGVTPSEPVHQLHKKVDQAVTRVGIAPEHRAFHPHITLARLGRVAGSELVDYLTGHTKVTSTPFQVTSFALFESQLTPNGAIYTQAALYPPG